MTIDLTGLCEQCKNEKCRRWMVRNLDGIDGNLTVHRCEFYEAE